MLIYLIYTDFEAKRNVWFVDRLIKCGEALGAKVELLIRESLTPLFIGGRPALLCGGEEKPLPDAVINRTQDHVLAKHFETAGTRVFNSSEVCRVCNDKMLTFELAASLGIPFIDTEYHNDGHEPGTFPAVIKPLDGKGGKNVMLVNSKAEFDAALPFFQGVPFLSQKVASDTGTDLRLYFLGGRMIASFLRYSDGDFRSNYGINGNARVQLPDDFELDAAHKLVDALKPDFVGIDFIFDKGKPLFNEVEDCVGSRMIYANTDIDVAEEYIKHILESI